MGLAWPSRVWPNEVGLAVGRPADIFLNADIILSADVFRHSEVLGYANGKDNVVAIFEK